jgi:hypothetical protein
MDISRSRLLGRIARRVAIVAAIVGITMVGNLRLQASEVTRQQAGQPAFGGAMTSKGAAMIERQADAGMYGRVNLTTDTSDRARALESMTDEDDADDAQDDVQLVPAIYAWDPDVRFVYFRHVSKWM